MPEHLIFEWWGMIDAGLVFNRELALDMYKPGEMVQAHVMLGAIELWTAYNSFLDRYWIAAGKDPTFPDAIGHDEFYELMEFLMRWSGQKITVPEVRNNALYLVDVVDA